MLQIDQKLKKNGKPLRGYNLKNPRAKKVQPPKTKKQLKERHEKNQQTIADLKKQEEDDKAETAHLKQAILAKEIVSSEKYRSLEAELEDSKAQKDMLRELGGDAIKQADEYKRKYEDLVKRLRR